MDDKHAPRQALRLMCTGHPPGRSSATICVVIEGSCTQKTRAHLRASRRNCTPAPLRRQLHCAESSEGYGKPRPSSRESGR